jgi:hypothetical protein
MKQMWSVMEDWLGGQLHFEHFSQFVVRPGDDLDADNFANATGSGSAGIGGCLDCGDVALDESADQSATDFVPAQEFHVGCLDHRVSRLEQGNKALAFDHAQRIVL